MTTTSLFLLTLCALPMPDGWPLTVGWDEGIVEAVVQSRIKALENKKNPDRVRMLLDLKELGPRASAAIPTLMGALTEKGTISEHAQMALGEIGTAAVPSLIKTIETGDKDLRVAALNALANIGDLLASDTDYAVRRRAANFLGKFSLASEPAVPALVKVLREMAVLSREGKTDLPNSEPLGPFSSPVSILSYQASCILQAIGEPAVPPLAELLKDPDPNLRLRALRTLKWMDPGVKSSVPAVLLCLKDKDADIRSEVADSLGHLGRDAPEALPALNELLRDTSLDVRFAAARSILGWFPPSDEAMFFLLEALRDSNPDVKKQASELMDLMERVSPTSMRLAAAPTVGLLASPLTHAPLLATSALFPPLPPRPVPPRPF